MSVVTTQPTFTPVKLRKGLEPVDGFDIHFGETPPVPVPGYRLVRGALVGSGPSPMSVQLGDDIIDDLSTMFSFRGGTRANNALPPEQLMYAIMLYPGLGELARELMRQFPDVTATSREGFGPVWHLWAAAAAIQTSNVGLDTLLGSGDTFERLADIAVRVHGWDVAWHPCTPYRVGNQRHFLSHRLPHLDVAQFRRVLRESGVGLARTLGQFPAGVAPDPCNPDPRHVAYGDGTVLKTPTDVTEHVITDDADPFVETLLHKGSKAVNPRRARVDREVQRKPGLVKNFV